MIDLERLWAGDHRYFEELVREYGPSVLGVARSFGQGADEVEDLFQESWRQAWEKRRSFRGDGEFGGWLYRLAMNACRTHRRYRVAYRARLARFIREGRADEMVWQAPDPSGGVDQGRRLERLRDALAELPERQRDALVMRVMEGRSTEEVSEIMKVTSGTVRSLIRHATDRLRQAMGGDQDEDLSRHDATA